MEVRNQRIKELLKENKEQKYKDLEVKYGEEECIICLCQFEGEDKVRKTPDCNHVFHSACILEWMENGNINEGDPAEIKCPHCSSPLKTRRESINGDNQEHSLVRAEDQEIEESEEEAMSEEAAQ